MIINLLDTYQLENIFYLFDMYLWEEIALLQAE